MADIPWHLLSLAYGIGAGIVSVGFFFLCGLAITPPDRHDPPTRVPGFDGSPAVLGSAVYVLLCWFGIRRGIPLTTVIAVFAALALVIISVRFRAVSARLRALDVVSPAALWWVLAFALLYTLGYVFFTPPVSAQFLPLATGSNQDLHWYLTFTKYLQELGPSNVADYSFLNYVYLQTPAVFYLLGFFSAFFDQEPLWAAMPAQFVCTALIGLVVARISREVFPIPCRWAVAIACILVSGPFFRYVAGNYFLSTLMSLPVLLHLLWTTVAGSSGRGLLDPWLALRFWAHYVLLLFLYPAFLFAGVAFQIVVLGLVAIASIQSDVSGKAGWGAHLKQAGGTAAAIVIAGVALIGLVPGHVAWALDMARYLSQAGVAGWPLDFISPLAIFGVPGPFDHTPVTDPAYRPWAIGTMCLIATGLVYVYFWRYRKHTTVPERTFVGFGAGVILAYCGYFLMLGPSYQQWKFASYFTLPLSFVVFAGNLRVVLFSSTVERAMATPRGRLATTWLTGVIAIGFVGGNVLVHVLAEPPLQRWDGGLRNLALIDQLPSFRELDVELEERGATMLAAYFIRHKTLHMVSRSYYPSRPLVRERISDRRPYLIQNFGCEGVGHGDTVTIPGVGCLLLSPPSVTLDTPYPFGRTYLPVALTGFSQREPWGRWNQRNAVQISFSADVQRTPIDRDAFVNLQIVPGRLPRVPGQRFVVSWGAGRQAEALVADRQWISLPLQRRDWAGGPRLFTLEVSVTTADAVTPPVVEPRSAEPRPFAVGFENVSISATPRGRVVGPPQHPSVETVTKGRHGSA
jgi:hypothetical protein